MALTFAVSASIGLICLFYFIATLVSATSKNAVRTAGSRGDGLSLIDSLLCVNQSKVMLVGVSIVSCLAFIFLVEPLLEKMLPDTVTQSSTHPPALHRT